MSKNSHRRVRINAVRVALTLNTYSHITPGLSGEAARTMDRLLGP